MPWHMGDFTPDELAALVRYVNAQARASRKQARGRRGT